MRNLKRVLSLALALVMVLGMMVVTTSAAAYADAEEITYKEAVEVMSAIGIITGDNGKFYPTNPLSREGAAKILAFVTLGPDADKYLTGTSADPFTDVKATRWSAKYVAYCKNLGIINGVDAAGTMFNPNGNISTVGFGKLLLGALQIEGTYTGAGWENNVKAALEKAKLDVVTIDASDITREEACQMALAAMKHTAENAGYVVKEVASDEVVKKFTDIADAIIYTATLNATAGSGSFTYEAAPATGYLLNTYYTLAFDRSEDDFGRPGVRYTNGKSGAEKIDLFYADKPLATFEGPVTEGDLFAAAGIQNANATSFTYKLIEDGCSFVFEDPFTAHKAIKGVDNHANWTAAGTGYGIKTELYKVMSGSNAVYTLVAIRDYMAEVTTVSPAKDDDARSIKVTLNKLSTGFEETRVSLAYETEKFALNDKVLVNVSYTNRGPKVQAISYPGVVEGKVTKITDKGVYTIAGSDYVKSQNWVGDIALSNVPGAWYVDSQGNLLAVKTAGTAAKVWNYGYLIEYANDEANQGSLLEAAKENVEKIKIFTAEGKTVVFDGAFTVAANGAVTFVGKDLAKTGEDENQHVKPALVRYILDTNGKIKEIENVESGESATGAADSSSLTAGKANAVLAEGKYVNDKTLYFVVKSAGEGAPAKYAVYTGYNSLPSSGLTGTAYEYFYVNKADNTADTSAVAAVALTVAEMPASEQSKAQLVWFAGTDYYTSKNAAGNNVYTYTNVYLNGVKGEISFLGSNPADEAQAGFLWSYTTNTTTGYATLGDNMGELAQTANVTVIENGYYVTNHSTTKVIYVGANTKYFQVDAATKAVTQVEGMPAVSADYTIKQIMATNSVVDAFSAANPATVVYFTVSE